MNVRLNKDKPLDGKYILIEIDSEQCEMVVDIYHTLNEVIETIKDIHDHLSNYKVLDVYDRMYYTVTINTNNNE